MADPIGALVLQGCLEEMSIPMPWLPEELFSTLEAEPVLQRYPWECGVFSSANPPIYQDELIHGLAVVDSPYTTFHVTDNRCPEFPSWPVPDPWLDFILSGPNLLLTLDARICMHQPERADAWRVRFARLIETCSAISERVWSQPRGGRLVLRANLHGSWFGILREPPRSEDDWEAWTDARATGTPGDQFAVRLLKALSGEPDPAISLPTGFGEPVDAAVVAGPSTTSSDARGSSTRAVDALDSAAEAYVDVVRALAIRSWPSNDRAIAACMRDAAGAKDDMVAASAALVRAEEPANPYGPLALLVAAASPKDGVDLPLRRVALHRFSLWRNPLVLSWLSHAHHDPDSVAAVVASHARLVECALVRIPGVEAQHLETLRAPFALAPLPGWGWLDPGDESADGIWGAAAGQRLTVPSRLDLSLRHQLRRYAVRVNQGMPEADAALTTRRLRSIATAGLNLVLAEYLVAQIADQKETGHIDRQQWVLLHQGFGVPAFGGFLPPDENSIERAVKAHLDLRMWTQRRLRRLWGQSSLPGPVPIGEWVNGLSDGLESPEFALRMSDVVDHWLRRWMGPPEGQLPFAESTLAPPDPHLHPAVGRDNPTHGVVGARERDPADEVLDEILALVGAEPFKEHARGVVALHRADQRRRRAGIPVPDVSRHLVLVGNPGTGKTTAARLLARLYRALGVLAKGHLVEVGREDLVSAYADTAAITKAAVDRADGGVLFIDEAYSLAQDHPQDHGHQAIDTLVREMENRRGSFVLMAAGYRADMQRFLSSNEGLRGRFGATIEFPDLSDEQLSLVAERFLGEAGLRGDASTRVALSQAFAEMPRERGFANARAARQLVELIRTRQAARVADAPTADLRTIIPADVPGGEPRDQAPHVDSARLARAQRRLDSLVGLTNVKTEIHDLVSLARVGRLRAEHGLNQRGVVGHAAFLGNPGTGKTTIANILGEVFVSLGLLPSGHTVVCGRGDLVGRYIGDTAVLTTAKVDEAEGGVLFVDEAYTLAPPDAARDFGREAVDTLVQLMEERRGRFVCILAGYPDPMHRLLNSNPGLPGRITYQLNFPDYSTAELVEVLRRQAADASLRFDRAFELKAASLLEAARGTEAFANARTVRSLLDAAIRGQARRLEQVRSAEVDPGALERLNADDLPNVANVEARGFGFVE